MPDANQEKTEIIGSFLKQQTILYQWDCTIYLLEVTVFAFESSADHDKPARLWRLVMAYTEGFSVSYI